MALSTGTTLTYRLSGIKYVTPNQRHYGQADAICAISQKTYEDARQRHPQRWSRQLRNRSQPQVVSIDHPRLQKPVVA
jgi:hypothetical protein